MGIYWVDFKYLFSYLIAPDKEYLYELSMLKKNIYKADKPNYLVNNRVIQEVVPLLPVMMPPRSPFCLTRMTPAMMVLILLVAARCLVEGKELVTTSNNGTSGSGFQLSDAPRVCHNNGTSLLHSFSSAFSVAHSSTRQCFPLNDISDVKLSRKERREKSKRIQQTFHDLLSTIIGNMDITEFVRILQSAKHYGATKHFSLFSHLNAATMFNRREIVRLLLEEGINPNGGDDDSVKVLELAACYDRADIATMLVRFGARADQIDQTTKLAEHQFYGLKSKFYKLLVARSQVELVDLGNFYYMNPLHIAARYDTKSIQSLIDQGAKLEVVVSPSGATPLHLAAHNEPAAVEALLLAGANPYALDTQFRTPVDVAIKRPDILDTFLKILQSYQERDIPLMHRAAAHSSNAIPVLIGYGHDPNVVSHSGETPLHIAVINGNLESAKKLLDCKADPNKRNWYGDTPLHHATRNLPEAIPLLIASGANIKLMDELGFNALHFAIHGENLESVKRLLEFHPRVLLKELTPIIGFQRNNAIRELLLTYIEEQEKEQTKKRWLIVFTITKFITFLLITAIGYKLYSLIKAAYNKKAQETLVKQQQHNKNIEFLNKLTQEVCSSRWQIDPNQSYRLNLVIHEQDYVDKQEIVERISETLKLLDSNVTVLDNYIVMPTLRQASHPPTYYSAKLSASINKLTATYQLNNLKQGFSNVTQSFDACKRYYEEKLEHFGKMVTNISEKQKSLNNIVKIIAEESIRKRISEALNSCNEILQYKTDLKDFSPAKKQVVFANLKIELVEIEDLARSRNLDKATFKKRMTELAVKVQNLESTIKNLFNELVNIHQNYQKQWSKIEDCDGLLKKRKIFTEEQPEAKSRVGLPIENSSPEIEFSDPILEPFEELDPIVEEHLVEAQTTEMTNNDKLPLKNHTEVQADTRHQTQNGILITPARMTVIIPEVATSFFASNQIFSSKPREKPSGDVASNLAAASEAAANFQVSFTDLENYKVGGVINQAIPVNALCYHLIRFLHSLWHLTLNANMNEKSIVGHLRNLIVHASLTLVNPYSYRLIIESGRKINEDLIRPFILKMKNGQPNLSEVRTLIANFSYHDIKLFQVQDIALTEDQILCGIFDGIEQIKILAAGMRSAQELRQHLQLNAAIKMLLVTIGEYCDRLKKTNHLALKSLTQLMPSIPWVQDGTIKPKSIINVFRVMRNAICHTSEQATNNNDQDVEPRVLFKLISTLPKVALSRDKIIHHILLRENLVHFLNENIKDRVWRYDLASEIVSCYQLRRKLAPEHLRQHLLDLMKIERNLQALKTQIASKYRCDPNTNIGVLTSCLREQNHYREAQRLEELNFNLSLLKQSLIERCSQSDITNDYIDKIAKGLKWGEVCQSYCDQLHFAIPKTT